VLTKLRQRFQDYFRYQRYGVVARLLGIEATHGLILDLGGGSARYFASLFPRPHQVIVLEIEPHLAVEAREAMPGLLVVIGDGQSLPFAQKSLAATICNSVIEHVAEPKALAAEVERVSQRYFVQTPNGSFPLEPHSFIPIPLYRQFPWRRVRSWLCRLFRADFDYIESVHYLSEECLANLFADASLYTESVLGLTKSFYLVKR
jgi:SAM-dependent methyltransferase